MEILILFLALSATTFLFYILLNPLFWQSLRNSEYLDKQRRAESDIDCKDLINPDEEIDG